MKLNIKKLIFQLIAGLLALLFLYIVLYYQIPAIKKRIIFFTLLLFADFYLWNSLCSVFKILTDNKLRYKIRDYAIAFIYWMPALLTLIIMCYLLVKGMNYVNGKLYFGVVNFSMTIYLIKFACFCLLFLYDAITFIIKLFRHHKEAACMPNFLKRKRVMYIVICLFFVGIGMAVFGIIYGKYNIQTKEINIVSSQPIFKDKSLKIVHISDLHLSGWNSTQPIENMVSTINNLKPDLIMITGDLVHSSSKEALPYKNILNKLKATMGIYSVMGNHDYGRYCRFESVDELNSDIQQLIQFQHDIGWNLLLNENCKIAFGEDSLTIAGIEYWSKKKMFFNKGKIKPTFAGIKSEDYTIFLSHDPQIWEEVVKMPLDIDLTLSGHTHGMQLGIYNQRFRCSPAAFLYKYWGGLYTNSENKEQHLYVNVGLASVGIPFRIGVYPEITVINILSSKKNSN